MGEQLLFDWDVKPAAAAPKPTAPAVTAPRTPAPYSFVPPRGLVATRITKRAVPTPARAPRPKPPEADEGGSAVLRPWPFQVRGINFLRGRQSALLLDDMGLGKTVQALLAISECAIVVGPAVVKTNWRDECRKWRPDLTPVILSGRGSFRWPKKGELLILNPAILPSTEDQKRLPPPPSGLCLIADECHVYKSHKTQQTKRWRALRRRVMRGAGYCWGMTGTPLLNRPNELWAVLQSFGVGTAAFKSWFVFVRCFKGKKKHFGGHEWGALGDKQKMEIGQRLRTVALRRTKRDVLKDLPERLPPKIIRVPMDAAARKACAAMEKVLQAAGIDVATASDEALRTALAGVGFEELSRTRAALATCKLPHAMKVVESFEEQDTKLIVASAHTAPIRAIGNRPGWAFITGEVSPEARGEIVKRFQAGQLLGVAMTIKAGGVGITLTRASDVLFIDREWTPALNEQTIARVERIGQDSPIQVTDLIAEHVIDTRLWSLLQTKEQWMEAVDAANEKPEEAT